ncbi:MAG: twin-arginine translocation signal domain-containing protein, partial [Verrucomicrobiia bacterium]
MKSNASISSSIGRRQFLGTLGAGAAGMALGNYPAFASTAARSLPMGKADHCIMLWL